jgi:hypothetical protein
MSDNTAIVLVMFMVIASFTSCTINSSWTALEMQKLQLERDKAGIK